MVTSAALKKIVARALIAGSTLMSAQIAHGVTAGPLVKDAESVDSVSTSAATRANADVQIRRIKNLMVFRQDGGADQAIAKFQRLQRDLRGEK